MLGQLLGRHERFVDQGTTSNWSSQKARPTRILTNAGNQMHVVGQEMPNHRH